MLSYDQIMGAKDIPPPVRVRVPEWGGDVYVKVWAGLERDQFDDVWQQYRKDHNDKSDGFRAALCIYTICDQSGKLLFTLADIPALSGKSARALARVYTKAAKLNGIGQEDELEKNSDAAPSE